MISWSNCLNEFKDPTCVIIKHNNPCGVASTKNIEQSFIKAYNSDRISAFGGIIFYVDESGQHGLVSAMENVGQFQWGCFDQNFDGALGISLGTGYQNTLDIVSGCIETPIASSDALNYENNGYDDWYLPSINELQMLVEFFKDEEDGFIDYILWSSTNSDLQNAFYMYGFNSNDYLTDFKYQQFDVRPIRSF